MLKAWLQNPDLDSIEVEEKYRSWVANLRTDRYVTVGSPFLFCELCSYEVVFNC